MVADDCHHEIITFPQQRGPHLETGAHFVATGLELAETNAAVRVWPAKNGRQFAQPAEQISARACWQRGDLRGGAARLENSHQGIRW